MSFRININITSPILRTIWPTPEMPESAASRLLDNWTVPFISRMVNIPRVVMEMAETGKPI